MRKIVRTLAVAIGVSALAVSVGPAATADTEANQRMKVYYSVDLVQSPGPSAVRGHVEAGTYVDGPDNAAVDGAALAPGTCGTSNPKPWWRMVYVPGTTEVAYAPAYCVM